MRTTRIGTVLLAVACLLSPTAALGTPTAITILHVNDTHSHLDAFGQKDRNLDGTVGGLAKAATVIATLRATDPNPLLVHAGDLFNGDAYFAAGIGPGGMPLLVVPELQLLQSLGLDVLTLGNHEFGLGTPTLDAVLWGAFHGTGPSVLTANIDLAAAGLTGLAQPSVVKEVGGVRVGFFGMTALDFLSQGAPFLARDVAGTLQLAAAQAAALRAAPASADVVIFLSHLGFELDQVVAASVPGLDAIVGGHSHTVLSAPVMVPGPVVPGEARRIVPVVQAGSFYQWVGELTLLVEDGEVSLGGYRLVPVDARVPRLPAVAAVVGQLKAAVDQRYGVDLWKEPIALALLDVDKEAPARSPLRDSPVGDLVTDALRARGGTDIALTANGFLTEGLTRGPLVGDDAFRIVGDGIDPAGAGLGFPLYELRIDGKNLLAALETSLALGDDLSLQVSGMSYVYDSRKPAGSRLVDVRVGGKAVKPTRIYRATVNLGVVQGLAAFPGVTLAAQPSPLGTSEYVAVRDYLARLRLVLYFTHGRVIDRGMVP
jgi:5'-nucleotidase / UDP-sugar diphosphatase